MKKALEEQGLKVLKLSFAGYLKSIVLHNHPELNKEEYRDALQAFGTDVVRRLEEDFWVHIVYHTIDLLARRKSNEKLETIDRFLEFAEKESLRYDAFIITDARFENELQPAVYTIEYDIHNVKINRTDTSFRMNDTQRKHESEQLSSEKPDDEYFFVINNDGGLPELEEKCKEAVEKVLESREKKYKEFLKECQDILEKYKEQG